MSTRYSCDYAVRAAGCKKCKLQLPKGELRLAKVTPNPFVQNAEGPPPDMKSYFHPICLFDTFMKARATTKVIEEPGDLEGWIDMTDEDKVKVTELIDDLVKTREKKGGGVQRTLTPIVKKAVKKEEDSEQQSSAKAAAFFSKREPLKAVKKEEPETEESKANQESKFNLFTKLCKLCELIADVNKHLDKADCVRRFFKSDGYDGDTLLILRFLIPSIDQRVYNIKERQLIKHFAQIFGVPPAKLTDEYNKNGDISQTIKEAAENFKFSVEKSDWSIQKIDRWLDKLAQKTHDEDQLEHLRFATKRLSPRELQYLLRLIKKDMRFNAGAKVIFDGFHPNAYEAFQSCRDLADIVKRVETGAISGEKSSLAVNITLGTPILPMLAEACKSVEFAMKRCSNGMLAEIKYDGERVQIHKKGDKFDFFSRSLKPVVKHKVALVDKYIVKAFPDAKDLILDAEILMVDTATGKPLPFGTLGIHKKEKFSNAVPCLFVFDCLLYDDVPVKDKPLSERKKFLEDTLKEVPNHVMHSNYQVIKHGENHKLKTMILKAIDEGLEGLVLKDLNGVYEPGKRHWLKVKKDYLEDGGMADTADLIVLGAYYGTGNKGGKMSVFLMGVYDEDTETYRTVCKMGNGHTDEVLDRLNKELKPKMRAIKRDVEKLPKWLRCSSQLCPDFVMMDPKQAPVWEITGAEFSRSTNHTADGISIRFPRVTKIRDDKDVETATCLRELKILFENSKEKSDVDKDEDDSLPIYSKDKLALGQAMHDSEGEDDDTKHLLKQENEQNVAVENTSPKRSPRKRKLEEEKSPVKSKKRKSNEENMGDDKKDEQHLLKQENEQNVAVENTSPKRSPRKRKLEEEKSPVKSKKRKSNEENMGDDKKDEQKDLPACKWGSLCSRKNPQHLKEFAHPKK
ncbi:unnamed protein product, partial [Mesorhabditis belari]|uniref:DNA ligase n=1 Tax=Mesorhabditis belari TaxID=2138241 RepID=A0AAF3ERM7_9BILA